MEKITSLTNPTIKRLKSLDRKKNRNETGLFLAEGARLIAQGLKNNWQIDTLLVAESSMDRPHIAQIASDALGAGGRIISVPERLIAKITKKDNAQNLIAAFVQKSLKLDILPPGEGRWVALFEVRDPGNLGTIVRTLDCAGVTGLVIIGNCCDPYSVEAVRASMGSVFDLPVAHASTEAFLEWRLRTQLALIGVSVNGSQRHDYVDYSNNICLLLGNEQSGLPQPLEDACDALTLIPMRGGADSLNLAQATAIATYEVWRQRDFS